MRLCPLKTPKQPAKLRRVAFLGGAAPSRPKSRPGGRLASKRFAAARSEDTTFSRLTARKCCCHPRRGKRQKACALPLFASPFLFTNKFSPKWAWLGGHPGVWMQFHVRSILAPGTAPGRMACSTLREHGKNRSLPAEEERLRKLGVQGGIPPGGVPGLAPGGGFGKGG